MGTAGCDWTWRAPSVSDAAGRAVRWLPTTGQLRPDRVVAAPSLTGTFTPPAAAPSAAFRRGPGSRRTLDEITVPLKRESGEADSAEPPGVR
jgi:hypothetical protein